MEIDEINIIEDEKYDKINIEENDGTEEIGISGEEIIYKNVNDYEKLKNQPSINDVTLIGNKTSEELNLQEKGDYPSVRVTNLEIDSLFK